MIGRVFRVTVSAATPSTARVERASPSRSAPGRDESRSRRWTGTATGEASSRRCDTASVVRGATRPVAVRLDGFPAVARRAPGARPATAFADPDPRVVASSAASSACTRPARTTSSPAVVDLVDETTSNPPGPAAGSAAATAGSSVHVGATVAVDDAGCGATTAGAGAGCSTRSAGGVGCGCTGGGAGAGAGAGATTFWRPGRNASGSR